MAKNPRSVRHIKDVMSRSVRYFAALVELIERRNAEGAEDLWREYPEPRRCASTSASDSAGDIRRLVRVTR